MSYQEAIARIEAAQKEKSTELDLSGLEIESLPELIKGLTNLKTLYLNNNKLSGLPSVLSQLDSLEVLNVSSNLIETILGNLPGNLRALYLNNNKIKAVPENLRNNPSIEKLYITQNNLAEIPEWIDEMSGLVVLNLSGNQIRFLPDSIGGLLKLKTLNISHNQIESLPDSFRNLAEIEAFYCYGNNFSIFPDIVGSLLSLKVLDFSANHIVNLSERIISLSELETLDLSSNKIESLPDSIGKLFKLKELYFQNNCLSDLPISMEELKNIERLYLHENSELGLPEEVLGPSVQEVFLGSNPANPRDILDYYFRSREGFRYFNEARLILVGGGRVGKTSLIKRMQNDSFDPIEPETFGIEIHSLDIKVKFGGLAETDEMVRLHVWDFGGQEFVHATHRFFLTPRSLYLLVLTGEAGRAEGEAEYWLELIQGASERSRVLLVLNKSIDYPFDVNRGLLEEKFKNICGFIKTDCQTGLGIKELKEAIEREVVHLEHVHSKFPAKWFRLKDRISEMSKSFLTSEQFRQLCSEYRIEDSEQDTLADILHTLGIALNYRNDQFLKNTRILNPRWVTEGIYSIIYSKPIREAQGVVSLKDLDEILDSADYPKPMQAFLMRLMQKYELCFQLSPDCFLLPDLLDVNQPEDVGKFKSEDCLNFEYHYSVLPQGLIPRFIVRTHEMSDGEPRWRTGVILRYGDCRALVRADVQGRKIVVRIMGKENRRRYLLDFIRTNFSAIHDAFRLNVEEMVPLPSHPHVTIGYEKLISFEEAGIESFPEFVDGKPIKIIVSQLLDGVRRIESETLKLTLIEAINNLLEGQFNTLTTLLPGNPAKWFAGQKASPAERAVDIVRWATSPGGCGLEKLAETLDDVIGKSWRDQRRRF
jgi:internalin A